MILDLNDTEARVLKDALAATIGQLDDIMESTPSREVADAANTLSDIYEKMGGDDDDSETE